MADDKVVAVSEMSAVLERQPISSHLKRRENHSHDFLRAVSASKSMLNQENMNPSESEAESISPLDEKEESLGEDDDGDVRRPGKKRRLTVNQVKYLEKHFEVENKLEPERKVGLAKELGLQPRQVAIWFQNRRARLKTKQLEKDYGSLKPNYDKLMADYVNLLKQNEDLKTKINEMKEELLKKEKRRTKMGNLEQVEAMAVQVAELESLLSNSDSNPVCNLAMATRGKQGEASSDKSDTFDSESPFNTENHSSLMEAGNSAQSNFSQNEEDDCTTLFPQFFPKLEEEEEFSKSCVFGFPDDEQKFCFWPYFSSEI